MPVAVFSERDAVCPAVRLPVRIRVLEQVGPCRRADTYTLRVVDVSTMSHSGCVQVRNHAFAEVLRMIPDRHLVKHETVAESGIPESEPDSAAFVWVMNRFVLFINLANVFDDLGGAVRGDGIRMAEQLAHPVVVVAVAAVGRPVSLKPGRSCLEVDCDIRALVLCSFGSGAECGEVVNVTEFDACVRLPALHHRHDGIESLGTGEVAVDAPYGNEPPPLLVDVCHYVAFTNPLPSTLSVFNDPPRYILICCGVVAFLKNCSTDTFEVSSSDVRFNE